MVNIAAAEKILNEWIEMERSIDQARGEVIASLQQKIREITKQRTESRAKVMESVKLLNKVKSQENG